MADFFVHVSTPDLPGTLAYLRGLAKLAEFTRPALEEARDEFEQVVGEIFSSEGPGWRPHRPLTTEKRAGQGNSGPILQETGALEASYSHGNEGHFERWGMGTGAGFVETGSQMKYARPHEDGFDNRGTVPRTDRNRAVKMRGQHVSARPIFGQHDEDMTRRIADRYERAVLAQLGL